MNDFIYQCALTGISNYIYNTSNKSPKWMDSKESKAWKIGYNYARNLCKN